MTNNCLRFFVGFGMHFQREQLYVKNDILSFFDNLLHLLMKVAAVGSVGVGKNNNPDSRFLITQNESIL